MSVKLIVTEKPSVARDIAKVLNIKNKHQGYMSSNEYYITWAVGHLVTLKEPEELNPEWKRWQEKHLPMIPKTMQLKVLPNTHAQFSVIKSLMDKKEVTSLICATDAGREGELIFRYIYKFANCNKPFERLWISSMTDEAISQGLKNLRPSKEYDPLYTSAKSRSEADWLIGMNATRAFTLRYGQLLSIGRVQTPTLQMLVKRRKEIDAFVAKVYYTVQADLGDFSTYYVDAEKQTERKIEDKVKAQTIAKDIKGKQAEVASITNEEKSEPAPQLYDLTTLQREASNMLGFTADKTLKTAQNLYEKHKIITYPRTDSRYLPEDMLKQVHQALNSLPKIHERYSPWLEALKGQPLPKTKRVFDKTKLTDHHAIIPTGKVVAYSNLSSDEAKLFDLVARKFIAAFYPPYLYNATKILCIIEGHNFVATGTTIIQEGFKILYKDLKETGKKTKKSTEKPPLPSVVKGEKRNVVSSKVSEEKTKAPKELNDATLLSAMEYAGKSIEDEELREQFKGCSLGTPATRAAIIERLITVGYAMRKGRQIVATPKGVCLIEAVPDEMASPEITGKWEQALEQMASGKIDDINFRAGIERLTSFLTNFAKTAPDVNFPKQEQNNARVQPTLGISCPLCKEGEITENSKAFGCNRWREGCRFTIWKNMFEKSEGLKLTAALIIKLFNTTPPQLVGKSGILTYHNNQLLFIKKEQSQ